MHPWKVPDNETVQARIRALKEMGHSGEAERHSRRALQTQETYGLVYEKTALKLLSHLSRTRFRALVRPDGWVANPVYRTAPKVPVYDPRQLLTVLSSAEANDEPALATRRERIARERRTIDAKIRIQHTKRSKEFVFRARPPAPNGGQANTRRAIGKADIRHLHYQMQISLYDSLVAAHGSDKVSCEGATSAGRPADIVVSLPDGYELFEIKTALAARDCVREAFGQLLEYAYWPGSPDFNTLWIVGPSPIDSETQEYLDGLRERFGIPVGYRHEPIAALSA